MADGRYVGKYLKSHNAPTKGPIWTKLGWSHPIMSPTCPHDTVAMATAVANGALNIQQLWASGGQTRGSILMKFSTQQQIRTSTTVFRPNIILLKFKMADGRYVEKYSKCHNSPTSGPTVTQLWWSKTHHVSTCPPCCGCHGNGRCLATAH